MSQPLTTGSVRNVSRRRVVPLAIVLALVVIAGVSIYLVLFWGEALPFFTISQAELGNWDDHPQDPALLIIATPGEVNDLATTLMTSRDPRIIGELRSVDYDHEFAVLAFYGLARSAGYSITVRQVQRRDVL